MVISFFSEGLPDEFATILVVVAWFLGALFLSFQGTRFVMLMVPPFAITFAVALGRLQQWADGRISLAWPSISRVSSAALTATLATVLILPVAQGYSTARSYLPKMNAAWWSTLISLRQQSPRDAIVNTWWDYGYWVKYVAERRVNNDGGSLRTHIPYWTARALAAPSERESAGLLRMLDCGSDATPEVEGSSGAYGKLLSYGLDDLKAEVMLSQLARMGRRQAQAYLAEHNLTASMQSDVLRSTHCDPPAAYLILTSSMEPLGWWYLANWDFGRAFALKRSRLLPQTKAIAELVARFGYSNDDARTLIERAGSVGSQADELEFLAPAMRNTESAWLQCHHESALKLACDADADLGDELTVKQVIFNSDDPAHARLVIAHGDSSSPTAEQTEITPGTIIIAEPGRSREVSSSAAEYPDLAVLIDVPGTRVRLATLHMLRSTFFRLMYLGGRDEQLFEKVHEETGFGGERVALWKINWQRLETFDRDAD